MGIMKYKLVKVPADKINEVKELVKTETEDSEKEEKKMKTKTGVKVVLVAGLTAAAGGLGYLAARLGSNKEEDDEFESREYVEVNPVEPDSQDAAD